jgi:hypothetical protein
MRRPYRHLFVLVFFVAARIFCSVATAEEQTLDPVVSMASPDASTNDTRSCGVQGDCYANELCWCPKPGACYFTTYLSSAAEKHCDFNGTKSGVCYFTGGWCRGTDSNCGPGARCSCPDGTLAPQREAPEKTGRPGCDSQKGWCVANDLTVGCDPTPTPTPTVPPTATFTPIATVTPTPPPTATPDCTTQFNARYQACTDGYRTDIMSCRAACDTDFDACLQTAFFGLPCPNPSPVTSLCALMCSYWRNQCYDICPDMAATTYSACYCTVRMDQYRCQGFSVGWEDFVRCREGVTPRVDGG